MPYRILIDLQGAQNNSRLRGIGRYSLALSKAIARNAGEHQVFILLNGLFADTIEDLIESFGGSIPRNRFLIFHAPGPVWELNSENDWRRRTAEILRERAIDLLAPDILLVTSLFEGAEDDTIVSVGRLTSAVATCAIIYDLIPYLDPVAYLGWEPIKRWYDNKLESLRRADYLFAISQSTLNDAVGALGVQPDSIRNISSAVDRDFFSSDISASQITKVTSRYGIGRRYIMHSSAFDERKNFQGLIRAYGSLPQHINTQYQLVLVCKLTDKGRNELESVAAEASLSKADVILTGFVPDDELVALYAGCHLFVFPSFSEGFGLPALEAMSCGVPTIGSRTTSIPEVIGREDALFDPTSLTDMASLISRVLTDHDFYVSLREHAKIQASKFSWDESARRTIEGMESIMQRKLLERPDVEGPAGKRAAFEDAIAAVALDLSPTDAELVQLARAIDATENAVVNMRSEAVFGGKMSWRLEGPFDSTYSLSLVNRETARALEDLGHKVVLHSTEGPGDFDPNPEYLVENADLGRMWRETKNLAPESASAVSRNLFPPRVHDMRGRLNLLHQYAWEETGVPAAWINDFNRHLHGVACTSTHVEKVLLDNGMHVPTVVTGDGVDHWERVTPDDRYRVNARSFRFLHVSSCFARKGVDVLLDAYGRAFTAQDDVSLVIKTFANPHNEVHRMLADQRSNHPDYPDVTIIEGDLSDGQLKSLYEQCNVMVAPSRAEGFGLPLAEAILSGLAVVTTGWSGQLDFCTEETAWLVDYSFQQARSHFSLYDSLWAEPDVDALALSLISVYSASPLEREAKAKVGRDFLMRHFNWRSVAARLVQFAVTLRDSPPRSDSPKIGWITTWNTKCGIATYSGYLLKEFPQFVTVFAAHDPQTVRRDSANCIRSWRSNKDDSGLVELADQIGQRDIDLLVVQFNYGFFNFRQFSSFIEQQLDAGRVIIVMMHSTGDPGLSPAWNWTLAEILPTLSRCQRLLVHSVNDLNRLKDLGLVDNVTLFPHGILDAPLGSIARGEPTQSTPLIATYGFALPHKGLTELITAVGILRDRATPVRLRLVNAEYPAPVSAELVAQLRALVARLKLEPLVELEHRFLEDDESLRLLQEADLIVFPYQHTQESASGAVRFALAASRPVAVTPIDVFSDLGDIAYRLAGIRPEDIADGITDILEHEFKQSTSAKNIESSASKWREAHRYGILATRLHELCRSLARHCRPYEKVLYGSSSQLLTEVGKIAGRALRTSGAAGCLVYGPYLNLPAGTYRVRVLGRCEIPAGARAEFAVYLTHSEESLPTFDLKEDPEGILADCVISLQRPCRDLEVRITVDALAQVTVNSLRVSSAFLPELVT